ncbi:hypothetical protein AB5N19_07014 [Seiridium cardinale]|uniref:Uncharacterized protein n=1 Tax=Seiridium cardinale TaxID=138064 RepID=A0ABR2XEB6_9PEZI
MCRYPVLVFKFCNHRDPDVTPPGPRPERCGAAISAKKTPLECPNKKYISHSKTTEPFCPRCKELVESVHALVEEVDSLTKELHIPDFLVQTIISHMGFLKWTLVEQSQQDFKQKGPDHDAGISLKRRIDHFREVNRYVMGKRDLIASTPRSAQGSVEDQRSSLRDLLIHIYSSILECELDDVEAEDMPRLLHDSFTSLQENDLDDNNAVDGWEANRVYMKLLLKRGVENLRDLKK